MYTLFKRALIACCFAFPALACAAERTPEIKPVAPVQTMAPVPATTAAVQAVRIGYVDIVRIGTESEQGKALKSLLMAKKDLLQVKIDRKKKQIEKLKTSIEAKVATMTPQQREARSREFQKKVEEFQSFVQASEEELRGLQEKETKALYDAVEHTATTLGAGKGFAAIVIKKELLYVGNAIDAQDVTDDLIKALNQADRKK